MKTHTILANKKKNKGNSMNDDFNNRRHLELLNYSKKKHLQLLKDSQDLKQQGTSIPDELRKDFSKLRKYLIILIDHLNWETRDQYLELLNQFIEKKIDIPDFCIAFCERYKLNEEMADILESKLVLLSPHEKSLAFGNLLELIVDSCEVCNGDPEPLRESYEIGHTEFRDLVKKTYLQIQKFLEE